MQKLMQKLLLAIIFVSSTAFAGESNIENYVHKLMSESINVLNDTTINQNTKTSKVRTMLAKHMDTNWMARFTLGRIIKTISEAQASNFIATYQNYVISTYARAVSQYKGEKVEIQSVQKMDEEFSIVKTQVHKSDGNVINVNYLVMEETSEKYKVCDVITEGISLVNSHKAEYGSIIASQGIDALIESLTQKAK